MTIQQLILIFLVIFTVQSQVADIILDLERKQNETIWLADSSMYGDNLCNTFADSKKSFEKSITSPQKCSGDIKFSKIKQNCIQNNLSYNTGVTVGGGKKQKKLQMKVDLMSPWSWVKGFQCQQFSRDGQDVKETNCNTGDDKYQKAFTSCKKENNCQMVNKCAEIDYQSEGLSVIGKFIDTRLKFDNMLEEDYGIGNQRLIMAYALSGQQNLQADGVLGLGKPQKELIVGELGEQNKEDLEEQLQEMQNDANDYSEDSNNPFDKEYFDSETNTSVLKNIQFDRFSHVEDQVFSLYIADSYEFYNNDDFKPHIQLGGMAPEKFVVNYNHNELFRMQWVKLHHEKYYLWQVPIQSISIFKDVEDKSFIDILKHNRYSEQETIENFEKPGIFSLSTTNLVLPNDQLKQLRDILSDHYSYKCVYDKKYLYNLYCKDLSSPIDLKGIYITINFDNNSKVVINPNDLVQKCMKEDGKDTYQCILNLQRSYNDHTILGEAVMKNYYWVFDTDEEKVGFAPAKNKYNEEAFKVLENEIIQELKDIVEDIEYDVEFIIRFSAIIVLLIISVISFKNVNGIVNCIYKCLGKHDRVRIQPQESEDFIDLKQQEENKQRALEKEKNSYENRNLDNNFADFDTLQINSQKQSILDSSKANLNNPFDSDEEDQQDIDDLDNGI